MPQDGHDLIDLCDGPFKTALDHTKYAPRYPDLDMVTERAKALEFLRDLDAQLRGSAFLFGARPRMADMAILPFLRQFAHIDLAWFAAQDMQDLARWLDSFKASARFAAVMGKYPPWQSGQDQVLFA